LAAFLRAIFTPLLPYGTLLDIIFPPVFLLFEASLSHLPNYLAD